MICRNKRGLAAIILAGVATSAIAGLVNQSGSRLYVASGDPGGGGDADSDFAARCAATGVVKCFGVDTEGDLLAEEIGTAGDGTRQAFIDTSTKYSGAGALKFTMRSGVSSLNLGGYWEADLGQNFGNSTTIYSQFRFMYSSEVVTANNTRWNSSLKLLNFHGASSTCQNTEYTMTSSPSPTAGRVHMGAYVTCSGISMKTATSGNNNMVTSCPGDCLEQQGSSFTNGTDVGYNCNYQGAYQSSTPGDGNGAGCLRILPNVWYVVYQRIFMGVRGSNTAEYDAWIQEAAGGPMRQFHKVRAISWSSGGVSDTSIRKVRFETYMTEIQAAALSTGSIWYDELIISSQPIAAPST